jgi:hypothetical protein
MNLKNLLIDLPKNPESPSFVAFISYGIQEIRYKTMRCIQHHAVWHEFVEFLGSLLLSGVFHEKK